MPTIHKEQTQSQLNSVLEAYFQSDAPHKAITLQVALTTSNADDKVQTPELLIDAALLAEIVGRVQLRDKLARLL